MEPVEKMDHTTPPIVPLEAEIEALVFRLAELAGSDPIALLERLKIKVRVHNHTDRQLN